MNYKTAKPEDYEGDYLQGLIRAYVDDQMNLLSILISLDRYFEAETTEDKEIRLKLLKDKLDSFKQG